MKKTLLGLGAIVIAATPIIAVVSCGNKKKENKNVENIKPVVDVETPRATVENTKADEHKQLDVVKSVSDTSWTEEQQKAEEAANEKATADAEKAFADKKAELEKTATDESKANLEKALFNHMETLEENIADIQKLYEVKVVSQATFADVEAKFSELAVELKTTKEVLGTLHSTDWKGNHTIFVNNMQPYDTVSVHLIYDKFDANSGNGYHSDKFTVFIDAIDKYHDAQSGAHFQDAIDAIQKAIDILEVK